MSDYPEHDKMAEIVKVSQGIGDFLEWASMEKGLALCTLEGHSFYPFQGSVVELLAEHFDIDLKKIETEKREMLARLQEQN